MALAAAVRINAVCQAGVQPVAPTSVTAEVIDCVTDSTATAATSTELITPLTFGGSNARWVKVGCNGGRLEFRCRYHVTTDMTTPPIIYVIGAKSIGGAEPNPQFATDGSECYIERMDALSGVAGITLTRVAASDQRTSANRWTPWYSFTHVATGIVGDLNGNTHVLVLCSQASVGGTGAVEMRVVN